jgi:hypothetical protein
MFWNISYSGATLSENKISQGLKHLEILILDEADRLLRWELLNIYGIPPLLKHAATMVQRCNGTTAGLGYLDVLELVHANSSPWDCQTPMGEKDTIPLLT